MFPSAGTINCDRTADARWSGTLTVPASITPLSSGGFNPYTSRIRVKRGLKMPRKGTEFVPWGIYQVDDAKKTRSTNNIDIDMSSFETRLVEERFPYARSFPKQSARTLVEGLVLEAIPWTHVLWSGVDPDILLPRFQELRDRWGILDGSTEGGSIATALGGEMFFDGAGNFLVTATPSVGDSVDWVIPQDEMLGVLIEKVDGMSRDEVYNIVSASGQTTDGAPPIGPGYAWDNDPHSLTYAGVNPIDPTSPATAFGKKTRFYSSPFLRNTNQCFNAARGLLADSLGLQMSMDFTVFMNPALLPGDVVEPSEDGGRYLIDSWSADLFGSTMSCVTRTTKEDVGDVEIQAPTSTALIYSGG